MLHKYRRIKKEYEAFRDDLLKSGRLPIKDTGVGFWAISYMDDLWFLFEKIGLSKYKSFVDLGSGDGRVAVIASLFTKAAGIEYDTELHEKAEEIKKKVGSSATLLHKNYMSYDLRGHDIVFLNPDQRLHTIEPKLQSELRGPLVLYGPDFHPQGLKKVKKFMCHSSPVTIYSRD